MINGRYGRYGTLAIITLTVVVAIARVALGLAGATPAQLVGLSDIQSVLTGLAFGAVAVNPFKGGGGSGGATDGTAAPSDEHPEHD